MQRFAVIGLGRFGLRLARSLTEGGAEVIAIDKEHKHVEQIAPDVAVAVRLDSTDEDALRAQGIDKVNAAIVGIGHDFEASVMTTVVLKSMGVQYICARAEQEMHGKILRRIGADEVIFPEDESALRWSFKLIAPQIGEKLDFAPGFSLARYTTPESFDGKTLMQLQLRKKYQLNLIGLRRSDESAERDDDGKLKSSIISMVQPETVIHKGDLLWLVGSDENLAGLPDK
ncbi:MAG: TrkA family potassium uptake protein [Sedimentisphaerales bacterium]|nr:TrkA family potassium uptake protein [Sedimentisphaerales bacterium]